MDIITVLFFNRAYAILQEEMRNVGDKPDLNWSSIARGMRTSVADHVVAACNFALRLRLNMVHARDVYGVVVTEHPGVIGMDDAATSALRGTYDNLTGVACPNRNPDG